MKHKAFFVFAAAMICFWAINNASLLDSSLASALTLVTILGAGQASGGVVVTSAALQRPLTTTVTLFGLFNTVQAQSKPSYGIAAGVAAGVASSWVQNGVFGTAAAAGGGGDPPDRRPNKDNVPQSRNDAVSTRSGVVPGTAC